MAPLLLLGFAACGGEHGSMPAPPDIADPPPPFTGPVSLQITHNGAPAVGVAVVFQDAGVVGATTQPTDGSGTARVTMGRDGFVTVVNPFGPPATGAPDDVRTFAGVQPFDQLKLVEDTRASPITVTVTAPIEPTAVEYRLHTSCGSGVLVKPSGPGLPTGQLTLTSCGGAADVLLETIDSSGNPSRSIYRPNLPVIDGGTVALPSGYQAIPGARFDYSGIADGYGTVHVRGVLASSRGPVFETSGDVVISSGVGSTILPIPTISDPTLMTESTLALTDSIATHGVLDWGPNTGQFIDLWDDLLPELLSAPRFDLPRSVSWSEASFATFQFESGPIEDETRPDFVLIELAVERTGASPRTYTWRIAAPYFGPFVSLPLLPLDANDFNIAPGDSVDVAGLTTVNVPGGYGAVRARVLDSKRPEDLIEGSSGRIVYETLR